MATRKKRTIRASADPRQAYSMPYMSPLYFAPPMEYRDNWSQHVTFRSDPKVISKWIPKQLVPDPDGLMFMLTSYFFATGFGHYREATLCAHARFKGKPSAREGRQASRARRKIAAQRESAVSDRVVCSP